MLGIALNFYCIGAVVLGLLLGYVFAYSARQQQPNGNEIAGLFGTVLGGSAISLLNQFSGCASALPLYVIGVAVGYLIYVILLRMNWTTVSHLFTQHGLKRSPLIPPLATDPCCKLNSSSTGGATCTCQAKGTTSTN